LASGTEGAFWDVPGVGLPSVVVTDIHIHEGTQFLYAGTYGRSVYKIDLSEIILSNQQEFFSESTVVYPNPANTIVNVRLPEGISGAAIRLLDAMGRVVRSETFSEENIQLNISGLPMGIYFLNIDYGRFKVTKKLIVN